MHRGRLKPKAATVAVTIGDLREMKRSSLGLSPQEVKAGAKARAAGRQLFMVCRSTTDALTALVSGLPKSEVERFCRGYIK